MAGPSPMSEQDQPPAFDRQKRPVAAVFRHRNYRLFFSGQIVSFMGTWMQTIAQGWLVYGLTGSAAWLGIIGFAQQAPILFLSAYGGTLADRFDKRRILLWTQAVSMVLAASLAALTFSGLVSVWHVLALAFLLGLTNAIDVPARQSFTIELVGKDDLQPAIAVNSFMFNSARFVGPALAGLIVATAGEAWCFALNALSFAGVLAGLWAMRLPPFRPKPPRSPWDELKSGFAYASGHRDIRAWLLQVAGISFFGASFLTQMPVFSDVALGSGARVYGFLVGGVGIGALTAALILMRLPRAHVARLPNLAAAAYGLCLIGFSQARDPALAIAIAALAGAALVMTNAASNTLLQTTVDDDKRGRVMAFFAMAMIGSMPFGALAGGLLAEAIGVTWTILASGVLCLVVAIATRLLQPKY